MVLVLVCCWGFKHFEYVSDGESIVRGAIVAVDLVLCQDIRGALREQLYKPQSTTGFQKHFTTG